MSVSDTDVRAVYNGTGAQTGFTIPFDFELGENTQVKVYIVTVADGVVTATLQTEGALQDYTLTGGDIPNDVNYTTVTFNTAPAASDDVLIIRSTSKVQGDSYTNSSSVANTTIMNALDYLTRLVQELGEEADRSVKFRIGSQQVDIPIDEPTAGEFLAWAADGLSIVSSPGELGTVTVGAGTGILVKDSATNTVVRTLTGTANEIDVADGDGVSGNPTVGIADNAVLPGTGSVTIPKGTTAERSGTPGTGMFRYNSTDDQFEGYTSSGWGAIAGGGGGADIDAYFTNTTLESSTDGVSIYSDLSGTVGTYVDGTGGIAGAISIALSTTSGEVRQGSQSLKISKAASDASGEGASFTNDVTIDPDRRGSELVFSLSHDGGSANYNGSDVSVHAYDVTNSATLNVRALNYTDGQGSNYILGNSAIQQFAVQTSDTTASIRVSLHVASDSVTGSAWDLVVDRIKLEARDPFLIAPIGDWQSYTPTFTGFGTPTDVNFWYKQVGDDLLIRGNFVTGTTTATEGLVSLPSGKTIDTTKINPTADIEVFGVGLQPTGGTASNWVVDATAQKVSAFYDGVNTDSFEITNQGASDINNSRLANALFGAGERIIFPLIVIPIANASSNIAVGAASTFRMAPILAAGTRVTSQPTKLGEWRTLTKGTGTTATDAAPTDSPTAANGMRIYSAYRAGAGGAGEANEWQIFCGKNKSVNVEFYGTTGKTQPIDTRMVIFDTGGGLNARGINMNSYDPSTGILSVVAYFDSGSVASDNVGRTQATPGSEAANVGNCYFDVIVSENVQAIGFEPLNKRVTKILSANVTSDGNISDFTVTGLTIGKSYAVKGKIRMQEGTGGADVINAQFIHNGSEISRVERFVTSSTPVSQTATPAFEFVASASSLTVDAGSITSGNYIQGDTTRGASGSYIQVIELNNVQEVSSF